MWFAIISDLFKLFFLFAYFIITVNYKILAFFSLSTIQFSFTLAAKRHRSNESDKKENFLNKLTEVVFGTEIWSLILIFLTQDFPFFILRVMIMVCNDLSKNYMIYFLVSKNFILLILEVYRIYAIYLEEKENRIELNKIESDIKISQTQNLTVNDDLKQRKQSDKKEVNKFFIKKNIITKT